MKICPNCQHTASNSDVFCEKCGTKLIKKENKAWFVVFSLIFGMVYSVLNIGLAFGDWAPNSMTLNKNIISIITYFINGGTINTYSAVFSLVYIVFIFLMFIMSFVCLIFSIIPFVDKTKLKWHYISLIILFSLNFVLTDFLGATNYAGVLLMIAQFAYLITYAIYSILNVNGTKTINVIFYSLFMVGLLLNILSIIGVNIKNNDTYYSYSGLLGFVAFLTPNTFIPLFIIYFVCWALSFASLILVIKNKIYLASLFNFIMSICCIFATIFGIVLTGFDCFYSYIACIIFALLSASFGLVYSLSIKMKNDDKILTR